MIVIGTLDTIRDRGKEMLHRTQRKARRGKMEYLALQVRSPYGGTFLLPLVVESGIRGGELLQTARAGAPIALDGEIQLFKRFDRRFAGEIASFSIVLSHVGVFPTTEGVVFLVPTMTEHLRHIHTQFHRQLEQSGLRANRYYRPDLWVPHCIVTTDITPQQMAKAVEVLIGAF